MRNRWYYSCGGQKVVGPCSSAELKKLAASGRLLPGDMVRRDPMIRPIKAGRVKRLFAAPAT
jgi:hypothetical protein